jgi:predicted GIY-YIG superfamily endonuclease
VEFYVYMVFCADESIYTGHADNLEARLWAHNDGRFRGYTFERRPVRLIFQAAFPTREEALQAERQIKGWSRAKKLALADGDWELLQRLSLRRQPQKKSQSETSSPPFMVREPHHEREGTIL